MAKLLLQNLDGTEVDLDAAGLFLRRFVIESVDPKHEVDTTDGSDGFIIVQTVLNGRGIKAEFLMESKNHEEYIHVRNKVFNLFNGKTYFYLINSDEPFKRWKVKTSSKFTPDRIGSSANLEVSFISPSPYAESVVSTLDTEQTDVFYQVDTEENIQYLFDTNSFFVWNNGDVEVDPLHRWSDIKITFQGPSENLAIRNLTTGEEWTYNGSTVGGDVIELIGVKSEKNGGSILGSTNKKLITLAPGRNDFELVGPTGAFLISFDFRFYYI